MADGRWPQLMDEQTARSYLTFSQHDFRALITAGIIPAGVEPVPGQKRWHRKDLDRVSDRIFDMEAERTRDEERRTARRAAEAFRPPALRQRGEASR
jgi:hypothetical protein